MCTRLWQSDSTIQILCLMHNRHKFCGCRVEFISTTTNATKGQHSISNSKNRCESVIWAMWWQKMKCRCRIWWNVSATTSKPLRSLPSVQGCTWVVLGGCQECVDWRMTHSWNPNAYLFKRQEDDLLLWWWLRSVSWRNPLDFFVKIRRGYCVQMQETGSYPRFSSWMAGRDYKRIVLFPAWQQANAKQM